MVVDLVLVGSVEEYLKSSKEEVKAAWENRAPLLPREYWHFVDTFGWCLFGGRWMFNDLDFVQGRFLGIPETRAKMMERSRLQSVETWGFDRANELERWWWRICALDLVPFAMGPDWGDFLTFRRCGLSDPDMWPVVLIDWEDGRAVSVGSSLRDALVRWSEGD